MHDLKTPYGTGFLFLAAIFVTHMPEEDAFAMLARLMDQYHMRDFFQPGTEYAVDTQRRERVGHASRICVFVV